MNFNDRFWIALIGIIGLVICTLAIGLTLAYNQRLRIMAQAGYEEVQGMGTTELRWQKAKP